MVINVVRSLSQIIMDEERGSLLHRQALWEQYCRNREEANKPIVFEGRQRYLYESHIGLPAYVALKGCICENNLTAIHEEKCNEFNRLRQRIK